MPFVQRLITKSTIILRISYDQPTLPLRLVITRFHGKCDSDVRDLFFLSVQWYGLLEATKPASVEHFSGPHNYNIVVVLAYTLLLNLPTTTTKHKLLTKVVMCVMCGPGVCGESLHVLCACSFVSCAPFSFYFVEMFFSLSSFSANIFGIGGSFSNGDGGARLMIHRTSGNQRTLYYIQVHHTQFQWTCQPEINLPTQAVQAASARLRPPSCIVSPLHASLQFDRWSLVFRFRSVRARRTDSWKTFAAAAFEFRVSVYVWMWRSRDSGAVACRVAV